MSIDLIAVVTGSSRGVAKGIAIAFGQTGGDREEQSDDQRVRVRIYTQGISKLKDLVRRLSCVFESYHVFLQCTTPTAAAGRSRTGTPPP